jgi:hypothetical protein
MRPEQALVAVWQSFSKQPDFPFTADHCINGTRVAVDVLRNFGVRAKPASVTVVVFNGFAWQLYTAGVPPIEWPPHAWSVGVDPNRSESRPGQWDGHLVAVGDDFTLDISAGQFYRPGKIALDGPLLIDGALADDTLMAMGKGGLRVVYRRSPQANEWRTASGWNNALNTAVTRHVTNLVGIVLATDERNPEWDSTTSPTSTPAPEQAPQS